MSPLWVLVLVPTLALANDFNAMDYDKDGKVTHFELNTFIDRLDRNRDTVLTKDELFYYLNNNYWRVKAYSDKIFDLLDTDKNGKLNYRDSIKVAMAMDTNRNGHVEKAEYDAWGQNLVNKAPWS
ncbi:uncharacterized protein LOC131954938 [Physella acuta]|uniref:uncharacterized protein LOC131954938 n=1 Tax=Physella acuta TaxID=109671 RepID=UPI0027DCEA7C|nr:uncharacterized protein LOC131954938 [Physella acuta]